MLLLSYVEFKVTSLDGQWTSRNFFAIITPGLCMPLILGLPFLEHNGIICDHALHCCIHKKSGYNLLHPELPPPPPLPAPRVPLKKQLKINRRWKREALKELLKMFTENWKPRSGANEPVKPINNIAAVRDRISAIIDAEICRHKEKKLKEELKAIFEPAPHFNDLPTDVKACIHLIDPDKPIKMRAYPCP